MELLGEFGQIIRHRNSGINQPSNPIICHDCGEHTAKKFSARKNAPKILPKLGKILRALLLHSLTNQIYPTRSSLKACFKSLKTTINSPHLSRLREIGKDYVPKVQLLKQVLKVIQRKTTLAHSSSQLIHCNGLHQIQFDKLPAVGSKNG